MSNEVAISWSSTINTHPTGTIVFNVYVNVKDQQKVKYFCNQEPNIRSSFLQETRASCIKLMRYNKC